LTRTRKVRRRIIAERYLSLVEALYSGAQSGHIESEMTFEDGRRSTMRAELAIRDVAAAPVARAPAPPVPAQPQEAAA
jgi:long-chain acyl-CoA synthetase